jgi:hypothetical protein
LSSNKAGIIGSQENNHMSLLNGLAKPTTRKVDLAAMTLFDIVTEPIL